MERDGVKGKMFHLVFLPATEPDDETYGMIPDQVAGYPEAVVHRMRFPRMVWYNETVRDEVVAQIRALDVAPIVLVGFSKSGLGVWNIARETLPPWGTVPFYASDADWRADLPLHTLAAFQAAVPRTHKLVLISGANFHDEMCVLAQALSETCIEFVFLPRPHLNHHWQSGWIEEGVRTLCG